MKIVRLYQILLSDKPSSELLLNEKEIFEFIPELKMCKGFNQNNEWHIYDVYDHILHVVDNVDKDLSLRLAALFHDIGKPLTYQEDENKVGHFYGHYKESNKIFLAFSNKYNIDNYLKDIVSNLIYYHDINISKLDELECDKLYKLFGYDGICKLFKLKKADLLAQNEKFYYILKDYDEQKKKILLKYKN